MDESSFIDDDSSGDISFDVCNVGGKCFHFLSLYDSLQPILSDRTYLMLYDSW